MCADILLSAERICRNLSEVGRNEVIGVFIICIVVVTVVVVVSVVVVIVVVFVVVVGIESSSSTRLKRIVALMSSEVRLLRVWRSKNGVAYTILPVNRSGNKRESFCSLARDDRRGWISHTLKRVDLQQ